MTSQLQQQQLILYFDISADIVVMWRGHSVVDANIIAEDSEDWLVVPLACRKLASWCELPFCYSTATASVQCSTVTPASLLA